MKSPRKSREKSPLFDGREFGRGETYQCVLPRFLRKKRPCKRKKRQGCNDTRQIRQQGKRSAVETASPERWGVMSSAARSSMYSITQIFKGVKKL